MRRNVLATELLLPLAVGAAVLIPLISAGLMLEWSNGVLDLILFTVAAVLVVFAEPLVSWLAPRLGLPSPRPRGRRRV